jgi:hypothetical protein
MSSTSVAVISSAGAVIGALGGVIGTGFFTLRSTRAQLSHQENIDQAQRVDQRATQHREIRRNAYVTYLDLLSETDDAIAELGRSFPDLSARQKVEDVVPHIRALQRQTSVVLLEGPSDVASTATELSLTLAKIFAKMIDILHTSTSTQGIIGNLGGDELRQLEEALNTLRRDFITVARAAIGGNLTFS